MNINIIIVQGVFLLSLSVHKSAEDYLEAILLIKQKRGCVRSIDIVNLLGFSKPSVSVAMKKLRENDYILMDSEGYITLTESGMNIAQKILEKYSMQDDFDLVCGSEFNGERGQKWEVIEYALEQFGISPDEVSEFQVLPGNGLTASMHGKTLCGGNDKFIGAKAQIPEAIKKQAQSLSDEGKTPLYFSLGGKLLGFNREDRITAVFCGSKKSLASGVPMASVIFAGQSIGAIVLPLMLFHQIQLMVCAWLARVYADRQKVLDADLAQGSIAPETANNP